MCAVSKEFAIAACVLVALVFGALQGVAAGEDAPIELPEGVQSVWGLEEAYRESTKTHQRICINGLWRWQPAREGSDTVPPARWGRFKVPACWPGITDYMQKDCQTVYAHPSWKAEDLGGITAAWYQRQITVPGEWTGRRIVLCAEYVNSFAAVYVDGKKAGELRFPGGEVDLSAECRPGQKHVLSMLVVAMPLGGVMLSYSDTASARKIKGRVARRGLCGDVYLASRPPGPRISDAKVVTSVRKGCISFHVALKGLAANDPKYDSKYILRANVADGKRTVLEFTSEPFQSDDLEDGRITLTEAWKPAKLWDVHTPQNMYHFRLSLLEAGGELLDASLPVRFAFREFWIDGRDFLLNGTRIFLSSVPLDNAQVGAAWATYDAARESMQRLKSFGINFVYTHNYGCEPGSHLSFEEILRAADDVGMLVALSQPHFAHYDWDRGDADRTNGYARHAAFYVRVAQNHPSVVAYSTSHNATGYGEDMNPDMIDGIQDRRSEWSARNVKLARRAGAIIKGLDSSRIVYHHASGNLGPMHTINFYANFVPIQEMSDWFEHWATKGVKPLFTCEYSVPMPWDWTMYRGWYQGRREFGSAVVPWEFCIAEWNAQFFGDRAYQISDQEKANLRWEAEQFRSGGGWHRWDYPHPVGSSNFKERYPVYAMYFRDNWPALRTWGMSANSPWNHGHYWTLRDGVDKGRREFDVDWSSLQRPGFSPDYVEDRYERIDLAFQRSDWIPTVAAEALIRNNGPLLAYIAGKPGAFTSKDHNFCPGETVEKQLIVINNSRETVTCDCKWSFGLPQSVAGSVAGTREITVATGQQQRVPLRFELPDRLASGTYQLSATFRFSSGQTQENSFSVNVLPRPTPPRVDAMIALFDPQGETSRLLDRMGIRYRNVGPEADLAAYDALVVGKNVLTVHGPAPDVTRVRDGLKVLLFEQTPEVLQKRFGFRVATYGLRRVFKRVPDHPVLAGIDDEHLRNWRGEATITPPRLEYKLSPEFNYAPTVRWCGIPVSRLWRCGNRGNVASVLIEKPARGDFLPILDGGYSLQYSPLMEYREGKGMVLFCQLDVTGRTESDPAAETLARNVLDYVSKWKPSPRRKAVYVGDPAGKSHLESAGVALKSYRRGKLTTDTVLVVGRGGGRELAPDAAAIADWLEAGGHLLAVGLDEQEANALLPMKVATNSQEHIASYFEPFGVESLLAGVGPADVHNPAPRELPLLSGSAAIGDGVLGKAQGASVVFCQLPPYGVSKAQHNLKRTYRRTSFLLTRLLGNMGVAGSTPLLDRFSTPLGGSGAGGRSGTSMVKNGDFSADAGPVSDNHDGMPDEWLFSGSKGATCRRQRIPQGTEAWSLLLTCPPAEGDKRPSTMLAQHDVPVKKGQWYRISLKARAERLVAESVTMTITNMATWRPFFEYQRFVPGPQWERFSFEVQSSGTADQRTRFQIWYDGAGKLWLCDVRVEPITNPTQGRWLDGLYLDVPEEWDDPYRFFRW